MTARDHLWKEWIASVKARAGWRSPPRFMHDRRKKDCALLTAVILLSMITAAVMILTITFEAWGKVK